MPVLVSGSPIDCKVSDWTYGECNCRNKMKRMTRSVVTPASNGGKECPALNDSISCTPDQTKCLTFQSCQPAYLGNSKPYKKYTCADRMSTNNNDTCEILCQKDPNCAGAFTTKSNECYECSLIDKDNIPFLYDNMDNMDNINKKNPDGEKGSLTIYKQRAGDKFKDTDKCVNVMENIN